MENRHYAYEIHQEKDNIQGSQGNWKTQIVGNNDDQIRQKQLTKRQIDIAQEIFLAGSGNGKFHITPTFSSAYTARS